MNPERAIAIRAFDYFAALSFGAVAALSSWYLIPDSLPSPLAMIAGMGVGMVSALPLLGLFMFLLGGFEIIVMSMQIGMLAGMIGIMTGVLTDGEVVAPVVMAGAMTGLTIQVLLHATDHTLHGEVSRHD